MFPLPASHFITSSLGAVFRAGLFLAAAASCTAADAPSSKPVATAAYTWRNVAILGGGFVSGVVFHPTQRDLVYARTDVGGAYRWDSAHARWIPLNDMLGRESSELLGVVSLAVDPSDAGLVYLACGQYLQPWGKNAAILRAKNRGDVRDWERTPLPFKLGGNEDGRSAGERLAVDPNDGRVLFLGTNHDGLWRSDDRARTWKRVASFTPRAVTFVIFDPRTGKAGTPTKTIIVGTTDGATPLLFSADAGATWTPFTSPPAGLIPHHAAIDSDSAIYVACANHLGPNSMTDGAVWKLAPDTKRWIDITPLKPGTREKDTFGYAGLSLDAQHPGTLIVTTNDRWTHGDEIFRTTDGGRTWTAIAEKAGFSADNAPWVFWHRDEKKFRPHWVGDIDIDPFNPDRAILITGAGVWRTENLTAADRGEATRWTFPNEGLEETVPLMLASPPSGVPLLSALGDIEGFRHDDLESSPRAGMFSPARGTSPSIDFAQAKPDIVVRTHWGDGVRASISRDGARTWTAFASAPPTARTSGPGVIAISAEATSLVWLPKKSTAFFSTDDGATWTESVGGPTSSDNYRTTRITSDRVDPRRFYIYDFTAGAIYVSGDGGATFASTASVPKDGGWLGVVPGREGELWLPTATGLLRSTDSGRSFSRIASVESAAQVGFGKAAPGRDFPAVFIDGAVGKTSGIFRSDDAGATWVRINDDQHRYGWIDGVVGDPRVFGRVYLATGGRGIIYGNPN